jgi:superfamily II DNA or RNA helicase
MRKRGIYSNNNMGEGLSLYQHQRELVQCHRDKMLIAWETGTGKTAAAICIGAQHDGKILITCPRTAKENWKDEIKMWEAVIGKRLDYEIYTKEEFKKLYRDYPKVEEVILDEAHYYSGMKSQTYKGMRFYLNKHQIKRVKLLTATPYMSTPWNIYALATLLGIYWAYNEYEERFFRFWNRNYWNKLKMAKVTGQDTTLVRQYYGSRGAAYNAGCGKYDIIPIAKPNIAKDIATLVNSIGVTKKLEDCVDIPPGIFKKEYFCLTNIQKAKLKEFRKQVGEKKMIPLAFYGRAFQIANGTLKGKDGDVDWIGDSEKLARILELIEEHRKLIIVAYHTLEIEMIRRNLPHGRKVLIINGKTEDIHAVVNEANASEDCILIMNAACSESNNLPTFSYIVFFSHPIKLKDWIQMQGRTRRVNNPQQCVYISLITKGTIDEEVYECVAVKKTDFQIEIYAQRNKVK